MTNGDVFAFMAAPDRETSLFAVSKAILKIRDTGKTYKEVGKAIGCDGSTVRAAKNEEHLLSFEAIARLCSFWPDETRAITQLWDRAPTELTTNDRLGIVRQHLGAIGRAAA